MPADPTKRRPASPQRASRPGLGASPSGTLLEETGYSRNADGLITQWGRSTLFGGGGSGTITFPMAFPNECFNVVATPIASPNTSLAYTVQIEAVTASNVLISGNRDDGGGTVSAPQMDIFWQALGN
jgi:hypothetical protein